MPYRESAKPPEDYEEFVGPLRKKYTYKKRKEIEKGWGSFQRDDKKIGEVFVYHETNPRVYGSFMYDSGPTAEELKAETIKLLYIEKDKKLSLHFHKNKHEIFYMAFGSVLMTLVENGVSESFVFSQGDDPLLIPACVVHQMKGMGDNNILLEVSTLDRPEDSYRVEKGD